MGNEKIAYQLEYELYATFIFDPNKDKLRYITCGKGIKEIAESMGIEYTGSDDIIGEIVKPDGCKVYTKFVYDLTNDEIDQVEYNDKDAPNIFFEFAINLGYDEEDISMMTSLNCFAFVHRYSDPDNLFDLFREISSDYTYHYNCYHHKRYDAYYAFSEDVPEDYWNLESPWDYMDRPKFR